MKQNTVVDHDLANVVRSLLGQICPKKDIDFLVEWLKQRQNAGTAEAGMTIDIRRQKAEQLRALLGCDKVRLISRQALKEHGVQPQALVRKTFRAMCGTERLSDLGETTKSRIRAVAIHLGELRKEGFGQDEIDVIVDFIIASSTVDAFASAVLEATMSLLPGACPLGLLVSGGQITGISKNDTCLGILV